MKQKPLFAYIIWCFGIAWFCNAIVIAIPSLPDIINKATSAIGAFAPTIAVIVLLKKFGIVNERKSIWQFLFDFPKKINAYGILLVYLAWRFLSFAVTGDTSQAQPLYMLFPIFAVQIFFQGGLEEPGWRGFLQPYFEKKYPLALSIVLVSILWAVWHIPLWFVLDSTQSQMSFLIFFLQILVNTCSLTAILKLTKSVAMCIIFHAWSNAVFLVIPFDMGIGIVVAYTIEAVASLIICLVYDRKKKITA